TKPVAQRRRSSSMATQAASPTSTSVLRRNALGLPQVVFQGITHIAPSINIVFTFPVIALKAGPDMPISFLLTTIVCLFIGNTVSQFSKYLPSSGGYYSFATRGLGVRTGFMTTWSYLIYDIIGPAGAIGFLGYLASSTFQMAAGGNIPWGIFALITFGIVWVLTHFGIRLSMRTTAIFGGIEILIMLALAFTFLAHPGPGSHFSAPLLPKNSPNHYEGILAGRVFSVLALGGFGAPAPWPRSRRTPTRPPPSATRCGGSAGGSSSSRSSTAPSAAAWPAPTRRPGSPTRWVRRARCRPGSGRSTRCTGPRRSPSRCSRSSASWRSCWWARCWRRTRSSASSA